MTEIHLLNPEATEHSSDGKTRSKRGAFEAEAHTDRQARCGLSASRSHRLDGRQHIRREPVMTARRPAGSSGRKRRAVLKKKLRRKKSREYSVYIGRERLGRYVWTVGKPYKAFDAADRPIGKFRTRLMALGAIRAAAGEKS
jgi:hypothetical protein